jgi:hypothetical protein
LINDGTINNREIIDFIYLIYDLIDRKFPIENEIVIEPMYCVAKKFEDTYRFIKEQKKSGK